MWWRSKSTIKATALGKQNFPVRVRLLTICRGELSAVMARLMSKCLWSGGSGREESKRRPPSLLLCESWMFVKEKKIQNDANWHVGVFIVTFEHMEHVYVMRSYCWLWACNSLLEVRWWILDQNFFHDNLQFLKRWNKIFPYDLKLADVSPISEKEDGFKKENYWPVRILPHMSKVIERIVYKQIDTFITAKFFPCLCGFRISHNAQYSLLKIIETGRKHLDKREKSRGNIDGSLKGFWHNKS